MLRQPGEKKCVCSSCSSSSFLPGSERAPCLPWVQQTGRYSGRAGVVGTIPSTGETEAPLDGGSQRAAQSAWYPAAKVLSVGDWDVVDGSPDSIEKALSGDFPFAKQGSTERCRPRGVDFPDWPEGKYGQRAP